MHRVCSPSSLQQPIRYHEEARRPRRGWSNVAMDALEQAQGLPTEQSPVGMETAAAAAAPALLLPEDKGKLLYSTQFHFQ